MHGLMEDKLFYNHLIFHDGSVRELMKRPEVFKDVPLDWQVVVVDIKNSTKSIEIGQFELINEIATNSLIIALSSADKNDTDCPFFFGGDGATLIVSPELLEDMMGNLITYQLLVKAKFELTLRVGSLSVKEIHENGYQLKLAKLRNNKSGFFPIVLGNGLQFAEEVIKSNDVFKGMTINNALDLKTIKAGWEIVPRKWIAENILYLIIAFDTNANLTATIIEIFNNIELIFGNESTVNPVCLVIDGRLNLAISGTKEQSELLLSCLEQMKSISFGHHLSKDFNVSQFSRIKNESHYYFVNCIDGGFSKASIILKQKMNEKGERL